MRTCLASAAPNRWQSVRILDPAGTTEATKKNMVFPRARTSLATGIVIAAIVLPVVQTVGPAFAQQNQNAPANFIKVDAPVLALTLEQVKAHLDRCVAGTSA